VINLAKKLFDDFKKRYLERTELVFSTALCHQSGRYLGISKVSVLASALDPCTKSLHLFIPVPAEHDTIWNEVLRLMMDLKVIDGQCNFVARVTSNDAESSTSPVQRARLNTDEDAMRALFDELLP
jgi:hypothetical protein